MGKGTNVWGVCVAGVVGEADVQRGATAARWKATNTKMRSCCFFLFFFSCTAMPVLAL